MEFEPRQIQALASDYESRMASVLFRCPKTSFRVQHWLDDDDDVPENEFEGIICPACTRLHFVDQKTGRLLGDDEE